MATDTFRHHRFLKSIKQLFVTANQARFDQRRFGLHILVRDLDGLIDGPNGVANLETEVPEWIKETVHQFRKPRQWFAPGNNLAGVQEHEIDVAEGIQFTAPITAQRHKSQRRKFFLRLGRQGGLGAVPEITKQNIDQCGAPTTNLAPTGSGAVKNLQAMRLDLKKTFVARELISRWRSGRNGKTRFRICFDFLDEGRHLRPKLRRRTP